MFMIRGVTKYLFGDTSKESIHEIPQGQLYLVRPRSPKGYSELIFKDAAASIRRTGQEFQYQLVIQRAYEEGEEDLDDEEEAEDRLGHSLTLEKDEKTFLLDESLHFRVEIRDDGSHVLAWRDLSGDPEDLYEFVCDISTAASEVSTFEIVAVKCQYERKYKQSNDKATGKDLQEFDFTRQPIPSASPVTSPSLRGSTVRGSSGDLATTGLDTIAMKGTETSTSAMANTSKATSAPAAPTKQPKSQTILAKERAELHFYDINSSAFMLQNASIVATVFEYGPWQYWLQISDEKTEGEASESRLGQAVVADLNPVFNFEALSFIFNHYTEDGQAYSWLLRFKDQPTLERFQEGLMQALWEQLNETKWLTKTKSDKDYMLEAFQDFTMEEAPGEEEEEEEEEEPAPSDAQRDEHYDSDESEEDVVTKPDDGDINSQIAVGYKHDRSYVVRGNKIGVFKHTPNNHLEFSTNISKVQTPGGKKLQPAKVMLHAEDANLILQEGGNKNSLFRMDLEYGKVVDEWKVHDDIAVNVFAPEKKFAQMTGEQTFLGLGSNALFRIDPRLAGNKLVDSQLKQYASKINFSAAATTEKGYIAVGDGKGNIRMFDRLGINAKTHIPGLGEEIIDLDVSADGRWILATCKTMLLLLDTLQKEGKNEGKLGFEKSFAKDSKPPLIRLSLKPNHVAQFQHETKAPLSFTPARFNAGVDDKETSIITATGPFVVTWNMKKLLAGRKESYTIKRYEDTIMADNFKFGTDKNVIVATPQSVDMIAKTSFKKPTRESIMATPRRSGRVQRLAREDVVNSPY